MPRNAYGSIHKHKIKTANSNALLTVFDAVKRYTLPDGTKKKKFRRCYTRPDADKALLDFHFEVENERTAAESGDHTFDELVAFYKQTYVTPAVFQKGQKIAGFKRNLNYVGTILDLLSARFGPMPLHSITYEHIYAFKIDYSLTKTVRDTLPAASTVHEKLTVLRRLFNVAIQKRWLEINPFRQGDALIKKAAEAKRNRMMTFDEEKRLLAACDNDDRRHLIPLIICAVDTAMRRGEIFDLEWWQIDLENRVIYIKESALEKTKTGFGGVLPISDRLYNILEAKKNEPKNVGKNLGQFLVFDRIEFKRSWRTACKDAGITDLQFRDLRSTGATRMVLAGNSESQVMKVTRHQNLKIFLENYSNVDVLNAQRIARNLSKFVQNEGSTTNRKTNEKQGRRRKRR